MSLLQWFCLNIFLSCQTSQYVYFIYGTGICLWGKWLTHRLVPCRQFINVLYNMCGEANEYHNKAIKNSTLIDCGSIFTYLWYVSRIFDIILQLTNWGRNKLAAILLTTLIFKCIFPNKNVCSDPISNILALVQIKARCRPDDKPLSEPMMGRLPTHTCVFRPQWVKAKINQ